MVLQAVDRYRVVDPMGEGLRVILTYRGEPYSPAYLVGLAGRALRVAGICPCAPTCVTVEPSELAGLLGYQTEWLPLDGPGLDAEMRFQEVLARMKAEIRAKRPVLAWNAFSTAEWDVVCGYDDETGRFIGRATTLGMDDWTVAEQRHMLAGRNVCPAQGALLVGERTGALDAPAAERAALLGAVAQARSTRNVDKLCGGGWVFLEGLAAYDRWVDAFSQADNAVGPGDAYCTHVYRSTHRAGAAFLLELAPRYPHAAHLAEAATSLAAEADLLDACAPLLTWTTIGSADAARNAQVYGLLSQARARYRQAVEILELAVAHLG
ncbi:MAG: hypothetical protein ACYC4R_00765 [Anaerolineae bacterium]